MTTNNDAKTVADNIRTRFSGHPDVIDVTCAEDTAGEYVVVRTKAAVSHLPLREGSVRIRQVRGKSDG